MCEMRGDHVFVAGMGPLYSAFAPDGIKYRQSERKAS